MRVVALALVLLGLPHVPAAECPSRLDVRGFAALVEQYQSGDSAPVSTLAQCPALVTRLGDDVAKLLKPDAPPDPFIERVRSDPRTTAAAVMLLTDALLAANPLQKGVYVPTAVRLAHVGREGAADFVGGWYAAMARWLRMNNDLQGSDTLMRQARTSLPADRRVLYESGVTAELLAVAYDRRERVHGEVTPRTPMVDRSAPLGDPRKQLTAAAEWFDQILAADPFQDLVAARLAHVLLLQDDTARSVQLGDAVSAHTRDVAVAYVADMIAGAALERDGDYAGAASRYERAATRFSRGQSARVALSEVLQRQGRNEEARAALEPLLRDSTNLNEPWWVFMLDSPEALDAAFADLRRVARP